MNNAQHEDFKEFAVEFLPATQQIKFKDGSILSAEDFRKAKVKAEKNGRLEDWKYFIGRINTEKN